MRGRRCTGMARRARGVMARRARGVMARRARGVMARCEGARQRAGRCDGVGEKKGSGEGGEVGRWRGGGRSGGGGWVRRTQSSTEKFLSARPQPKTVSVSLRPFAAAGAVLSSYVPSLFPKYWSSLSRA
eukprot:2010621-Pleurochrysis_carterae.AAC.1